MLFFQVVPLDSSVLDSDSDLEEIRHVIKQSHSQLVFSEHVFNRQLAKASPELLLASDFVSNSYNYDKLATPLSLTPSRLLGLNPLGATGWSVHLAVIS